MPTCFPFRITFNEQALLDEEPWQLYRVAANFSDAALSPYKLLSDSYSSATYRISLVDVTALIMGEYAPELVDHVEFDEEGYQLDLYLDSEAAVRLFEATICPVFQNLELLSKYMHQIADRDKA